MDGFRESDAVNWSERQTTLTTTKPRRWMAHSAHITRPQPHRVGRPWLSYADEHSEMASMSETSRGNPDEIILDGSKGEGGGQILRTALTLSLLTGRPFRMVNIRANRNNPGLRPQHKKAIDAAARLGRAEVSGAAIGGCELSFLPKPYFGHDLSIDIGTAGSTGLILQTLHLPLALRASSPNQLVLTGGTFNPKAPAFPFLDITWRGYLAAFGMPLATKMVAAGFYPRGGGRIEAWIEPATPQPFTCNERGKLERVYGVAGVANLRDDIARRIRDRAIDRLQAHGLTAEIELVRWSGSGPGAAISLTVEHNRAIPATFVGLGELGKPSEAVADEAVDQLVAFEAVEDAAVDPHSADQILLPLVFAQGHSEFTVSEVTEHLRTNAETIRAFLNRSITIEEPENAELPGRVVID
jgi:RNA 3'-terminal phosphate cyclase (ATP)